MNVEQNGFMSVVMTVVISLIIVGVVLVPIIDAGNGGGNGGGGGGGSGTVSVPAGLINSTYVGEAVFMSDQLGFEAISDTDITDTFPMVGSPDLGEDTDVRFGRCMAYLIDDTDYNASQGDAMNHSATLTYSIYDDEWTIDAFRNGTWTVSSWSLDATGHITPVYPNGKSNDMPDTYKVGWLWYDAPQGNYHDMGGMIAGIEVDGNNSDYTYHFVEKGQYIGVFDRNYYDVDYQQNVPVVWFGQVKDDWTMDIEYDVYDPVMQQLHHQEKNVRLYWSDNDLSDLAVLVLDGTEQVDVAVAEVDSYRGIITISETVEGPGAYVPLTISYQETIDAYNNDEWLDYFNIFYMEDGLIDGKLYSEYFAKVGDPKYAMGWDEETDWYTITPAGTFTQSDFWIIFDNGYGLKGDDFESESDVFYVWEFDSDIHFYGDTAITWYNPDYFTRGTFNATFYGTLGHPRNYTSNAEYYASIGTFTPDPNGDYLMFDSSNAMMMMFSPGSYYKWNDYDNMYSCLYAINNGGMVYHHDTQERYDQVQSYYHAISSTEPIEVESLSMSDWTYIIPMTLGYYVYDTEYDPSDAPVQVSESRSANAAADSDSGNNGGMSNTLLAIVPVFLVLGILIYVVQYFRENKGF